MEKVYRGYKKVVEGFCLFLFLLATSCAIENDIPYPVVNGGITDIRVEGQRAAEGSLDAEAIIDASAKTVMLYVNDSVDMTKLKLTRLVVNPIEAEVLVDSALCANPDKFPFAGFASLDSIPMSSNTRINFTNPVNFTIKTYQEYVWQVKVRQIIDRKIEAQGMIDYSIDESDSRVIIYVGKEQDLKNIHITSLALGGAYGEVTPDPTTVKDFTSPRKFTVQYAWSKPNEGTIWTVYVQLTDEDGGSKPSTGDLSVNAWSKYAYVEGKHRIPIARLNIRDKVKALGVRSQRQLMVQKHRQRLRDYNRVRLISAVWLMLLAVYWENLLSPQKRLQPYITVNLIYGIKPGRHGTRVSPANHFGIRVIREQHRGLVLRSISILPKEIRMLCIRKEESRRS